MSEQYAAVMVMLLVPTLAGLWWVASLSWRIRRLEKLNDRMDPRWREEC